MSSLDVRRHLEYNCWALIWPWLGLGWVMDGPWLGHGWALVGPCLGISHKRSLYQHLAI